MSVLHDGVGRGGVKDFAHSSRAVANSLGAQDILRVRLGDLQRRRLLPGAEVKQHRHFGLTELIVSRNGHIGRDSREP